ncbi:siderophore-interacting protein [Crossiella sp. SN42]|uniref:siderophore-interacting protein n=1 Tax=Crossiella sp. SN42 TaxID=2944808 RepID=UPI00207D7024|nr:siderophore-interacting protein [Crossiella sp. SN42]MCO1581330.1 siderophore-interacting protein [Crossiella sp. SN42]
MLRKVHKSAARKMITLEVLGRTTLSPHFVSVTLGGPELAHLESSGFDQGVRLFFPREGQSGLRMPTLSSEAWLAEFMLLPKTRRPWVRNLTIRRFRPERSEIDIEFAVHGDSPMSRWVRRVQPGDPAGIFDIGRTYLPAAHARWQLLVADESALPATLSILEQAPETLTAQVFLEVPEAADIRADLTAPPGVRVHWLPRTDPHQRPGVLALDTVRAAELPPGPCYAWVAGESKLATGLRRHLVGDRGLAKPDIGFVGYWRHGRSSPG